MANKNVDQSYPIPDLSTPEKTSAWIDAEMRNAQEYFREQIGIPKEVPAPPLVIIREDEMAEKKRWSVKVSFDLDLKLLVFGAVLTVGMLGYLAYSSYMLGVTMSALITGQ